VRTTAHHGEPEVSFMRIVVAAAVLLVTSLSAMLETQATLPRLRVSDNRRFLVTSDGKPFFWLGDTAWELFHRLNREDAERYLQNRAKLRFTVIQAVALAEFDGLHAPNRYGETPLRGDDPTQPNEGYFAHVDWIVQRANALGLYVGFLPTWGDKWNRGKNGIGPEIFTPANAERYGEWLGRRYKNAGLVWILGGDRAIDNDTHREIIRGMARGLRAGDGGAHLITFHPPGANSSSTWFHDEDWLDFNMRQNGHTTEFTGRYEQTRADYDRAPTKPVLDGEPIYEDHPVSFDAKRLGHSIAADVRRPLYWDLFSGAFGHTYGHHSVWQMWIPGMEPINNPLLPWLDAINQAGARQMQHGRSLIESRPFLTRVPADDVLVPGRVPTSMPGAGRYRFVATRDASGSYAMIYAPVGRPFTVRMSVITGRKVTAWWFNPRDGRATAIGTFENTGEREFSPPDSGEMLDWVLVLDDAAKKYPPPGASPPRQP
jgi:Protein of unknown function (DUF4038)/Putative collagen-binding domain of a collagenase